MNQDDAGTYSITTIQLSTKAQQRLWLTRNYFQLLIREAEAREINYSQACLSFGEVVIPEPREGSVTDYGYNDQFGLFKQEKK